MSRSSPVQQRLIDPTLTGVLGEEFPDVAHFGLADAVDAPGALLQPVGFPRQVVSKTCARRMRWVSETRPVMSSFGPAPTGGSSDHPGARPRLVASSKRWWDHRGSLCSSRRVATRRCLSRRWEPASASGEDKTLPTGCGRHFRTTGQAGRGGVPFCREEHEGGCLQESGTRGPEAPPAEPRFGGGKGIRDAGAQVGPQFRGAVVNRRLVAESETAEIRESEG